MANDFNIDVGFNTKGFTDMFGKGGAGTVDSGVGAGPNGTSKLSSGIGKGLFTALKATGIIALLMNLKVIVDLLSGILGMINLLVLVGLKGMIDFFKDPVRGLVGLAVLITNGFLTGIEALINFLPGVSGVEIGRFRTDIMDENIAKGMEIGEALAESFMLEDEYQKAKQAQVEALAMETLKTNLAEFALQRDKAELTGLMSDDFTSNVVPAFDGLSSTMTTFFINWKKAMDEANEKLDADSRSARVSFATSYKGTALTESEKLGAARLQSTTIKEADARAFNYLTGLSR